MLQVGVEPTRDFSSHRILSPARATNFATEALTLIILVAPHGFEPQQAVPKTAVLPLY